MKNKTIIILIILAIILSGLVGYKLCESSINKKGEMTENNDRENNEENVSTENKTGGKIRVLARKLHIRYAPNIEDRMDLGYAFFGEIYDVLEIIDNENYVWYKINKDDVTGYIANQKNGNLVEYFDNKTEILDVNSELIQKLNIPFTNGISLSRPDELSLKENYLYKNFDFDNSDNSSISSLVLNYYFQNNDYLSIPKEGILYYSITKNVLSEYFVKLFGPDKIFTPANVWSKNQFLCTIGTSDYVEHEYLKDGEKYLFKQMLCGSSGSSYIIKLLVDSLYAYKKEEEIYVNYVVTKIKAFDTPVYMDYMEEILDVVRTTGMDEEAFLARYRDGSAMAALEEDLALGCRLGIHSLPAYLLEYQGKSSLLRTFDTEAFAAAIRKILLEDSTEKSQAAETEN